MATDAKQEIEQPLVQQGSEVLRATLALEGMTCASCAMRIEKGLKKVPGVLDAQVNLATELGTVTYDPALTGFEQMAAKVEAIGYKANPLLAPVQQEAVVVADSAGMVVEPVVAEAIATHEATGALGPVANSFAATVLYE